VHTDDVRVLEFCGSSGFSQQAVLRMLIVRESATAFQL
jgi:hypothetical protein